MFGLVTVTITVRSPVRTPTVLAWRCLVRTMRDCVNTLEGAYMGNVNVSVNSNESMDKG